ncbi:hypothetical protein EDC17_101856 [Sphingobacterium alimentarium]|uniref:Uncharacterized protein n=1 Tax=Sphingobacterium alimentarium TaxID=797292 RepID=A0A4R3W015_9SPHI|nr:hypothetical protein EDC17_101856 [Sphingobacterium alimentarium]
MWKFDITEEILKIFYAYRKFSNIIKDEYSKIYNGWFC